MNYLAHAYLSKDDEGLLIGNFIADHLRGNKFDHLNEGIIKGIQMHRQIDTFTDNHDVFKKSKRVFYNGFEKYSGILVDIYFDHFLATNFNEYSNKPLELFSNHVYTIYQNNSHHLPDSSNQFLGYVLKNNIYHAYSKIEGIEKVLFHLSHRINHGKMLNESIRIFNEQKPELEENFSIFFNDIRNEFSV